MRMGGGGLSVYLDIGTLDVTPHLHVTLYRASLSYTALLVTTCSTPMTDSWHLAPPKSAALMKTLYCCSTAAALALGEDQMLNNGQIN